MDYKKERVMVDNPYKYIVPEDIIRIQEESMMNEIMPVISPGEINVAYWEGYRTSDEDARRAVAEAQNKADRKAMVEYIENCWVSPYEGYRLVNLQALKEAIDGD